MRSFHHYAFATALLCARCLPAAVYNVPAGDSATLTKDMKIAKPGDKIVLAGGIYDTGITTHSDGTAAQPITVEGINGATLYGDNPDTGEGIEVNNDYWIFQNLTLNGFHESFRVFGASYGIANNITTNNSGIESFKFKNSSTHWLVENCTVNNSGMEGYYCGDAVQNWTGGTPDRTRDITFYHDINNVNVNDGFDCKEGTNNIRIIDCMSNSENTVPGAADEGDSGVYNRGDNIQTINYTVLNNGSTGDAERCSTATVNGITYGSNASIYGLAGENIQGWLLYNHQNSTTIYNNSAMLQVAGGFLESGQTPNQPDPSTFVENTWLSTGGDFVDGSFLPVNMVWNNSQSAIGDGSSWDYNQQNFVDPGVNGNIPGIFFPGVAVTFNDSNNGHYVVTLEENISPGSVSVDNSAGDYVFGGPGGIGGGTSLSKTGTGALTLATVDTYSGATAVLEGKLVVAVAGALPTKTALTIGAADSRASVQLIQRIGTVELSGLAIGDGSSLDVGDDGVIVDYDGSSPVAMIRQELSTAYDGGAWDKAGIFSSIAAENPNRSTTLGYADTGTEVVIQYTWVGDANLDGMVNAADLALISAGGATWSTGDFNYDGIVNSDDYALFMVSAAVSGGASISATLPEPSIAVIVGSVALLSVARRSKCRPTSIEIC